MVITMAKLRMAHASTYGARKPPGPISYLFPETMINARQIQKAPYSPPYLLFPPPPPTALITQLQDYL